ncbi:protein phosphatase 1 regulatory subunit 12B isoform X2 [Stigmatopora nigra]
MCKEIMIDCQGKSILSFTQSCYQPLLRALRYCYVRIIQIFDSSGGNASYRLGRTSSYLRRETWFGSLNNQDQDTTSKDYKMMYAEALQENEHLKSRLQDSKQELVNIRFQLDKLAQRQDLLAEKSTILESEKKDKEALEKRVSGMEEEMKGDSSPPEMSTTTVVTSANLMMEFDWWVGVQSYVYTEYGRGLSTQP